MLAQPLPLSLGSSASGRVHSVRVTMLSQTS